MLCLRYRGLIPSYSHCLIDFAFHLSMSTLLAFLADVFVFAFFSCIAASFLPVEAMADVRLCSSLSTLSLSYLASITCSVNSNSIWCNHGFVELHKLVSVGKKNILSLSDFESDCSIIVE